MVMDMKIIGIILFLVLFLIWVFLFKKELLSNIDEVTYQRLNFTDKNTIINQIITTLGCPLFFFLGCSFLLLFLDNKKIAIFISIMMIVDAIIIFLVKRIFKRERPNRKRLVEEKSYSFPSGHTFSTTCFYGFLFFFLFNDVTLWGQVLVLVGYLFLVIGVASSRVYLGVHYFSDVVAGYLLASSYLWFCIYIVTDVLNIL